MGQEFAWFEQHAHEALSLWGENSAFTQYDAIFTVCKEFSSRNHLQLLLSSNANAHDNGDAKVEFDVFFDHLPAADFHGDLIRESVLFEGAVDQAPGA